MFTSQELIKKSNYIKNNIIIFNYLFDMNLINEYDMYEFMMNKEDSSRLDKRVKASIMALTNEEILRLQNQNPVSNDYISFLEKVVAELNKDEQLKKLSPFLELLISVEKTPVPTKRY